MTQEEDLILAGFKDSQRGWIDPVTAECMSLDKAADKLKSYRLILRNRGWIENSFGGWSHKNQGQTFSYYLKAAWREAGIRGDLPFQNPVDNNEKSRYPEGDTEAKDEVYTGGDKKLTFPHPLIGDLQGKKIRVSKEDDSFEIRVLGAYVDMNGNLTLVGSQGENRLWVYPLYQGSYEILPESKP